jgi:hypothetical protein
MSELRAVLPADAKERYQQGLKNTYTWNVSNGGVLRPEMPPGATNVVPGRPSHPAVRATLNTKTAAQLEAIEPHTIAIIMRFLKVEFCRP